MKKISLIGGFLLLGVLEQVQAVPLPQLKGVAQLHGYVQRVGQSEVKDPEIARVSRLSGDFTEAGLSLNWNIRPTTRFVGSVNYRSRRPLVKEALRVDIFSLSQTVYQREWGRIELSGGRLKNTMIGWHSAQDAPASRDGVEYARVYMGNVSTVFDSIDGVRLAGSWADVKGNSLHAYLYWGKKGLHDIQPVSPVPGVSFTVKDYDLQGVKLVGEVGVLPGLELGTTFVKIGADNRLEIALGPQTYRTKTDLTGDITLLMAAYIWRNWRFSGEWAHARLNNDMEEVYLKGEYETYYLSIVWQPASRWTMVARYEVAENFSPDTLSALNTALMQPGNTRLNVQKDTAQSWTLYARYHIGKRWFVGLEANVIDTGRNQKDEVLLGQLEAAF